MLGGYDLWKTTPPEPSDKEIQEWVEEAYKTIDFIYIDPVVKSRVEIEDPEHITPKEIEKALRIIDEHGDISLKHANELLQDNLGKLYGQLLKQLQEQTNDPEVVEDYIETLELWEKWTEKESEIRQYMPTKKKKPHSGNI